MIYQKAELFIGTSNLEFTRGEAYDKIMPVTYGRKVK